jgi:hypothetical protein
MPSNAALNPTASPESSVAATTSGADSSTPESEESLVKGNATIVGASVAGAALLLIGIGAGVWYSRTKMASGSGHDGEKFEWQGGLAYAHGSLKGVELPKGVARQGGDAAAAAAAAADDDDDLKVSALMRRKLDDQAHRGPHSSSVRVSARASPPPLGEPKQQLLQYTPAPTLTRASKSLQPGTLLPPVYSLAEAKKPASTTL